MSNRPVVPVPVLVDFAATRARRRGGSLPVCNRPCRLAFIKGAAFLWCAALMTRLFTLQIEGAEHWQRSAARQQFAEFKIASERGPVYDRWGNLLAVSVPAGSVFVRPRRLAQQEIPALSRQVAAILELDPARVAQRMQDPAPFVWIRRQAPKVLAEQVEALQIDGMGYVVEPRRFYPYNEAGSSLIGKVGIDGFGLSGVEAAFDRDLRGSQVQTKVGRDALGNSIQKTKGEDLIDFQLPRGHALHLSIDAAVQQIMSEELARGRKQVNAKSVMAVMIDAWSGEILAMDQAPSLNHNSETVRHRRDLSNQVIEMVFEPGSTMKPFVTAATLAAGLTVPAEIINCEKGSFRFGKHTINDVHGMGLTSVHDIMVRSSNIGMTKLGMRLGAGRLHQYLRLFGFGETIDLNLPGATAGILRPPSAWAEVDVATHSFGQGVAVTPLQMVRAMAALANGGQLPEIRLMRQVTPPQPRRVLSLETAQQMQAMLYDVVEHPQGTGRRAAIKGVRVGGKTGTAQKAQEGGRGYRPGAYIASFIGFVDTQPLGLSVLPVMMVVVDEARADSIYGGALAGPIFKRIMERTLRRLATTQELEKSLQRRSRPPAGPDANGLRMAYHVG